MKSIFFVSIFNFFVLTFFLLFYLKGVLLK